MNGSFDWSQCTVTVFGNKYLPSWKILPTKVRNLFGSRKVGDSFGMRGNGSSSASVKSISVVGSNQSPVTFFSPVFRRRTNSGLNMPSGHSTAKEYFGFADRTQLSTLKIPLMTQPRSAAATAHHCGSRIHSISASSHEGASMCTYITDSAKGVGR